MTSVAVIVAAMRRMNIGRMNFMVKEWWVYTLRVL
jgi:hypothetical protein